MNPILNADDLFRAQGAALGLRWLAGRGGLARLLEPANARFPGMALVGHLNFVHPNRVQVLGSAEVAYLDRLGPDERTATIQALCACTTTALVIVANDEPVAPDLRAAADRSDMPLFGCALPSPKVIDHLQFYLARALAARTTLHGVFLEVLGLGVFITGESGIGKSELALELLSRGHRMVGDDAVEFARVGPDALIGRCPGTLCDFLEVRGLGILNVRAMFGDTAVRPEKTLRLILHLEQLKPGILASIDRLQSDQKTRPILDVNIPEVTLYVAPGRNLAVLVEVAARNHILRLRGVNALDDLIGRQRTMMNKDGA